MTDRKDEISGYVLMLNDNIGTADNFRSALGRWLDTHKWYGDAIIGHGVIEVDGVRRSYVEAKPEGISRLAKDFVPSIAREVLPITREQFDKRTLGLRLIPEIRAA